MIMKKRAALGLALIGTLAVLMIIATIIVPRIFVPPESKIAEIELRAIYQKIEKALKRRDLEGLESVYVYQTPDFTQAESDGSVKKREQVAAALLHLMTAFSVINSIKFNITNIKMVNGKAQVSYRQELDANLIMDKGSKAKGRFKYTALGRDTWIKTPRGWRVQRVETFSDTTMFIVAR